MILSPAQEDSGALENHVELLGLGDCAVLKGSTLTVTRYKNTGGEVHRWSGTVKLVLKPRKGGKTLQVDGRFDSGVRPEAG